jgi:hypothetical protein
MYDAPPLSRQERCRPASAAAHMAPHVRPATGCEQNRCRRASEQPAQTAQRRPAFLLLLSSVQSSVHNTAAGLSAESKRTQHPDLTGPTHPNRQPARRYPHLTQLPSQAASLTAGHSLTLTTSRRPRLRPLVAAVAAVTRYPSLRCSVFFAFSVAAVAIVLVSAGLHPRLHPLWSPSPDTRSVAHDFPVPGLVYGPICRTSLAARL